MDVPREIQQALDSGWTILTANQRAARTLRHAYDRKQHTAGRTTWSPPTILAWDTWAASLWRRLLLEDHASALLLNRSQEQALWNAVITDDRATPNLRSSDSLAELAADAWSLLYAYQGRQRLKTFADTVDTLAFARWATEFERRCARANYVSSAELLERLTKAVAAGLVPLTQAQGVLLVGFDTKTPAQLSLLDAIATQTNVRDHHSGPQSQSPTLVSASDANDELATAARWLRTHLTTNPTASIAVIVPSIEDERAEIDRTFRSILSPELNDIAAPANTGPYEFSLGVPLAQTPIVTAAIEVLRWATAPLPIDRITALLLSLYFAPAESERTTRAEFDAFVLRRQHLLQPELSVEALYETAASHSGLPVLLRHLRALRAIFQRKELTAGERTHAEWTSAIGDILEAAGWSESSRDSTVEFRARRKWESTLDELTTLDFDGQRVTFTTALSSLKRIAVQTLFAPESRNSPIQIMGPLESAGSAFDAIWFLRAGDLTWPVASTPNPLLPWRLQHELGMPGVDSARDTDHSRSITERIAASASTVLFSYASQSAEDARQRPSAVLANLPLSTASSTIIAPPVPSSTPVSVEIIPDDTPIPPPPDRVFPGGASILAAQAACGFRAFAEKRLFATAPDSIDLGLDPLERGSLVHEVLQNFWAEVETQAALNLMASDERDAILTLSVDQALAEHSQGNSSTWNTAYLDTERQRLLNLLRPWLTYESNRPPFAVKSREQEMKDVHVGPLRLDIRIDRVDISLVEGQPAGDIILDYKTGSAKPADWLGSRPDAPQVPLYAIVSEAQELAAVAFANVRPGKQFEINGYQSRPRVLPKPGKLKAASLEAQVEDWRAVLTTLAHDFHSGNTQVAPKQYPTTCRYCEQRLLCRLDLTTLEADAIEDFIDESDETAPEAASV